MQSASERRLLRQVYRTKRDVLLYETKVLELRILSVFERFHCFFQVLVSDFISGSGFSVFWFLTFSGSEFQREYSTGIISVTLTDFLCQK